jgi:hypothetical protein
MRRSPKGLERNGPLGTLILLNEIEIPTLILASREFLARRLCSGKKPGHPAAPPQ